MNESGLLNAAIDGHRSKRGYPASVAIKRGGVNSLEKLTRGLYRLIDSHMPTHPDLAAVAVKVPHGGHLSYLSTGLPRTDDADSA